MILRVFVLFVVASYRSADLYSNPTREMNVSRISNEKICQEFEFSADDCKNLFEKFKQAKNRVENTKQEKLFLDTFVRLVKAEENFIPGEYLAIDVGGTYLKLGMYSKYGQKFKVLHPMKKSEIPVENIEDEDMFDWIVNNVREYFSSEKIAVDQQITASLTFSYPVKQEDLAKGSILGMCKNFCFKPINGGDPIELLNEAFKRQSVNVVVKAMINDTTATLLASHLKNKMTSVGVVLGTGTNGAYIHDNKIINSEWGHFIPNITPNAIDIEVSNRESVKKNQDFEVESFIGGIAFKKIIKTIFECDDNEFKHIMNNYYSEKNGNSDHNYIIAAIKRRSMRIIATLIAVLQEGKTRDYIAVGINGSGLENQKDKDMLVESIQWVYKNIHKFDDLNVQLEFVNNGSLIGSVYALSYNGEIPDILNLDENSKMYSNK